MIRFDTPAYQRATAEFTRSVVYGFTDLHPILGQIGRQATVHAGPTRNVAGSAPVDHPMFSLAQRVTIRDDVIRQSLLDDYAAVLADMANQFSDQLTARFIRLIREVTDATGNTVDAGGKPLSNDLIFDAIERAEIDFDDDDKPILPSIMMNPETSALLARTEPTEVHQRRFEEIIASKKAAHDAQKRHRRLPG